MRAINAQIIWCILLGSQYVLCTLTPDSKNKNKRDSKFLRGPQDNDVFTLNLVSPEPLAKDILIHHEGYYKDTALRRFNGTVLGYVTPASIGDLQLETTLTNYSFSCSGTRMVMI